MILVCGEALIDLFVGPAEGAEMPARAVAGGSPFNVAIGLARLGVDASFLGGISRDRFGALLARILIGEGVDDRFLVSTDRPSTISMVATDDNGQPSYAFHGEGAADRSLTLADLPAKLLPDVRALTFGSYTMAVEPVGSGFRRARRTRMRAARDQRRSQSATGRSGRYGALGDGGRALLLNGDHHQGQRRGCAHRWAGRVSIAEAAAYWLNCGARLVVVTEGAKGATAFCAAGHVFDARPFCRSARYGRRRRHVPRRPAGAVCENRQAFSDAIAELDLPAIRELLGYAVAAAAVTARATADRGGCRSEPCRVRAAQRQFRIEFRNAPT